jgi:hypothetical protein
MKAQDKNLEPRKPVSGHRSQAAGAVVKYDYPLTSYGTSAMSIRLRANIL